ncbi:glycosyltransferase [Corynebacterium sp. CCM 9186]|uniref:glycosyltransferase n=1 Tax=Corynebacterium meridianum TaxID=2765363 RepID=UPI0020032C7C|nr:glycosyltransferase [Corynebacterium meridianum]MCK7678496.1 glycosyltransferase [Corynebacterium meridianum]
MVASILSQLKEDPAQTYSLIFHRLSSCDRGEQLKSFLKQGLPGPLSVAYPGLTDLQGTGNQSGRTAWRNGDLTLAISRSNGYLKSRYRDERDLISGRLTLTAPPDPRPHLPKSTDILYVLTNSLPTTVSGYTCRTHSILSALKYSGLTVAGVTRISYPASVGRWSSGGVDVVDGISYFRDLPWRTPMLLSQRINQHIIFLSGLVDRLRPAAIVATTDWENGIAAKAVARAYSIPWIYEMRGEREKSWVATFPPEQQASAELSERYLSIRALETNLARSANQVVVLSRIQKEGLVIRGVPSSKISIAPNGCEPVEDPTANSTVSMRQKLGLTEKFVFGSISSIVDYEGLDLLPDCLQKLLARGIDAYLIIVGSGVSLPALREKASALGVAERCIFPGQVSPKDTPAWYRSFDVFCLPRKDTSVTRVITPMKSIAASANGIPIVASDLPALREIVPSPEVGTLVEPGDLESWSRTLIKYASKETVFVQSAAKAFAESRSWDTVTESLLTSCQIAQKEEQ